jgi:metal-responsive CopG/Arc/MetJ family transcriptional regulator
MNNKIPEEAKKVKISISIDPVLDKKVEDIIMKMKFYKKSRFIEFLIKKYIDENEDTL